MNISISIDQITFKEMESIRKEKRQSRSEYVKEALIEAEKKYNTELEINEGIIEKWYNEIEGGENNMHETIN